MARTLFLTPMLLLLAAAVGHAQRPDGTAPLDRRSGGGGALATSVAEVSPTPDPCSTLLSILHRAEVLARLERGEIYLLEIERPKKRGASVPASSSSDAVQTGIALAEVDADMAEVIDILADDSSFAEVFPYVAKVESREIGEKTVVYQFIDLPFPIRNLWYEVLVERQRARTEDGSCFQSQWRYVPDSGNIVDTEGRWELLERTDGRLLVAYVAWAEAGGMIPKWAENWAARRALPRVMEALKSEIVKRRGAATGF